MTKVVKLIVFLCFWGWFLLSPFQNYGQQIRFDNLKEQFSKKNLFRINGGLAANTVFYSGSNATRQPFMWVLSGNVNVSLFNQINLPFTCNLNNMGNNYSYPTLPNRLSLHPSYQWATAHIGDVSMSLSPYTLSGHQFTGAGLELTPENFPLKLSLMYGRLLKATEYDSVSRLGTVAYKRMGYGFKAYYERDKAAFGMTLFSARDDRNSLKHIPDSLSVFPQSNLAMSWEMTVKPGGGLSLKIETGISFMTRDVRIPTIGNTVFQRWFDKNSSTVRYHAVKAEVAYQLQKNVIGFGYERIAPGYQTLGAYYFTNDLENFTLNFTRPFFKDKLTMALNGGMEHDNLDGTKHDRTNRWVGSVNFNFAPNEKFNSSFSFSTFQSYTHIQSQFEKINESTPYDNLDTLDFTQLSQNMDLSVTYSCGNDKSYSHNMNVNLSYQEAADKRGAIIHPGSVSRFYNLAAVYGLQYIPLGIQLTASGNVSYNIVCFNKMLTCGPSLGASSRFFEEKVSMGLSFSFNTGFDSGSWTNSVTNVRWNTGWQFYKKHSASLVLVHQNRNVALKESMSDFTSTLNYSYNF